MIVKKPLFVFPEPPIPFGGAAARWYHSLLKGLSNRGITGTVLVCSGGDEKDKEAKELHGTKHRLHFFRQKKRTWSSSLRSLLEPFSYPYSVEMRDFLYCLPLDSFDLIQFETQFTGWIIDRPIPNAVVNILNLYCIDLEATSPKTFREKLFRARVLNAERKLIRRFSRYSALSERLAIKTHAINPLATGSINPLTIDFSLYRCDSPQIKKDERVFTVGLIGSFNWLPTASAGRKLLNDIWPQVKEKLPNAKLLLVGRSANTLFGNMSTDKSVEIHSDVDDTLPFFRKIDVMVYLPSVGSGMKIKVLEAIALGTLVITNEDGAEGLPESVATHIKVVTDSSAIRRILELSADITESKKTAMDAREKLLSDLSLDRCLERTLSSNRILR